MPRSSVASLYKRIMDSPKLRELTQVEIAEGAKINQSQVSRIMSGQFRRTDAKSIIRICEFAGIAQTDEKPLSPCLKKTLRAVWGGTRAQEEALMKLLRAADALAMARASDAVKRSRS